MTKKFLKNKLFLILFIFIIGGAALLPFINLETSYTMPGEYRWTLPTVVSTVLSDKIAVPKLWGHIRFKKPPIAYWTMSASAKIFGLKLLWTRMPVVLMALLALFIFYRMLLTTGLKNNEAFFGTLILLGMTGFYTYSRISALEIPMLLFTTGIFYGLSEFLFKDKPSGIYISALFGGLTLLTKSHASVISAIFFIIVWALIYRNKSIFKKHRYRWLRAVFIIIVIVLPWYIFLYYSYGPAFIQSMKAELFGDRFTSGHYNLIGMVTGLFTLALPYTLIYFSALFKSIKERNRKNIFFILYAVSIIFPYIFVNSHRMRYMVPALPALAGLIIFNYSSDKRYFKLISKITAVLLGTAAVLILSAGFWIKFIGIYELLLGIILTAPAVIYLMKNSLMKAAFSILLVNLFFLGFLYSQAGLWEIPDNIIKRLDGYKFSTFKRRPFFLPVKANRVQFNDVKDISSFKRAVKAGSLIYIPQHRWDKFNKLMDNTEYKSYDKIIIWKRFNEVPKKSDIVKTFKNKDINFLKEKTYFIKVESNEK